ncbi:helix-turn-helix domain-containing protein [Silanimonas sp.]|jgi:MerR family mercuric resistance operon transcriptional regulator|uniref:MerR family transcriptional regulator n=1 Tax=Silanimonas sp. TaxID=1929290 RepID=UPI0022C8CA26|nr:helix-turn-helix domain-containing protein [Silanimonas sp.]MCZ8062794.1 helix-turn-helix domain-containing protein [Silanimonas sp.]
MKIGELAAATGCHFETIRYYEKVGLLPKPQRTASGYRAYRPGDIARVRFITRGRALGFSLDEIRSLLHLSESPNLACGEVDALARQHLVEVREKLAQLQRMEAELVATIERCRGGQRATCSVLESLAQESPIAGKPSTVHSPVF